MRGEPEDQPGHQSRSGRPSVRRRRRRRSSVDSRRRGRWAGARPPSARAARVVVPRVRHGDGSRGRRRASCRRSPARRRRARRRRCGRPTAVGGERLLAQDRALARRARRLDLLARGSRAGCRPRRPRPPGRRAAPPRRARAGARAGRDLLRHARVDVHHVAHAQPVADRGERGQVDRLRHRPAADDPDAERRAHAVTPSVSRTHAPAAATLSSGSAGRTRRPRRRSSRRSPARAPRGTRRCRCRRGRAR